MFTFSLPLPMPWSTAAAPDGPLAAAPVAAAPSAVSKADLVATKSKAQLLTSATNKLASEGSPKAPVAAAPRCRPRLLRPPVAAAPVAAAPSAVSKRTWRRPSRRRSCSPGQPTSWPARAPPRRRRCGPGAAALAEFEAPKKGGSAPAAPATPCCCRSPGCCGPGCCGAVAASPRRTGTTLRCKARHRRGADQRLLALRLGVLRLAEDCDPAPVLQRRLSAIAVPVASLLAALLCAAWTPRTGLSSQCKE